MNSYQRPAMEPDNEEPTFPNVKEQPAVQLPSISTPESHQPWKQNLKDGNNFGMFSLGDKFKGAKI